MVRIIVTKEIRKMENEKSPNEVKTFIQEGMDLPNQLISSRG